MYKNCNLFFHCHFFVVTLHPQTVKTMYPSTSNKYFQLTAGQIDKVGNAMIYLSEKMPGISKTKMLKLLYLLDEFSIRKSGIPFFNLQYKVWKLGPVAEEIFVELSDKPFRFGKYVEIKNTENGIAIYPKSNFCDDEFSDNDIDLLEEFSNRFLMITGNQLVEYTHRPNTPWRSTAEENGVYGLLDRGLINNTELVIDMSRLVSNDKHKKNIYQLYMEECF